LVLALLPRRMTKKENAMDAIKKWIMNLFVGKYLGSWVRTALAFAGGWLVSKGIIDDAGLVESLAQNLTLVLSGVIAYFLAQGSSLAQKKIADKEIEVAKAKTK